jgi:hypothetical protein
MENINDTNNNLKNINNSSTQKCKCNRFLKYIYEPNTNTNINTNTNTNTDSNLQYPQTQNNKYYYCPTCLLSKEYCNCPSLPDKHHKLFIQEDFYDQENE